MLRINQSTVAQAKRYYRDSLDKGDYYFKAVDGKHLEVIGNWHGKTANMLGLSGKVEKQEFYNLIDNKNPTDGTRLTPRTNNNDNRRAGYDFTFSTPKSVSLVYELTGDTRILDAHRQAVLDTMAEIEASVQTRIRKNGADHNITSGNIAWAEFEHYTSRPIDGVPDMHLHTHAFVHNVTWNEQEQKFKAIQLGDTHVDRPYYEASYHAHLAKKLADVGYDIERRGNKEWEIKQISRDVIDKFSGRTKQVEQEAEKRGLYSDKAKDNLGAKTREAKKSDYTRSELRQIWLKRLGEDGFSDVRSAHRSSFNHIPDNISAKEHARDSFSYALKHVFERKSTIDEKRFKAEMLNHGVGKITASDVDEVIDYLSKNNKEFKLLKDNNEHSNRKYITTKSTLANENSIITFTQDSKNSYKSFASNLNGYKPSYTTKEGFGLNQQQIKAIQHILGSEDKIIGISGKAGVGKTSMSLEAVKAINASGKQVFTFAPTNNAVEVLKKEGFHDSHTIQKLLGGSNEAGELKKGLSGNVMWIDEASLLSVKDMKGIFDIANDNNARVILSGDATQHNSVQAGDAFRLLQKKTLDTAQIDQIQRQRASPQYKEVVEAVNNKKFEQAFGLLDNMDAIIEVTYDNDNLVKKEADKDFVGGKLWDKSKAGGGGSESTNTVGKRKNKGEKDKDGVKDWSYGNSPVDRKNQIIFDEVKKSINNKQSHLVVALTHAEGDNITSDLRQRMKQEGMIAKEDTSFTSLRNLNLTEAQKQDINNYDKGQVVQFDQNATGIKIGDRFTIDAIDNGKVSLVSSQGKKAVLPLDKAGRFNLYQAVEADFTKGDKLRITKNGLINNGKRKSRLNNGSIYDIASITKQGDIKLSNGWIVPKDYGHFKHGYVSTSHASQGQTVDNVIISLPAQNHIDSKSFYVPLTRGKKSVNIITDDKQALLENVKRNSGERLTATELLEKASFVEEKKSSTVKDKVNKMLDGYNNLVRYTTILCKQAVTKAKKELSPQELAQKVPFYNSLPAYVKSQTITRSPPKAPVR